MQYIVLVWWTSGEQSHYMLNTYLPIALCDPDIYTEEEAWHCCSTWNVHLNFMSIHSQNLTPHSTYPSCSGPPHTSLYVPDFTEERGELVVTHPPGRKHLRVVVVECSQLSEPAQQTGKVLWLLWMLQGTKPSQHVQHGLLKSLHCRLILHVWSICKENADGTQQSVYIRSSRSHAVYMSK